MAALAFPVGGLRMRPCVEDVLQMLKVEFNIDTSDEWRQVLAEGRIRWRRRQVGAAVRDAPEEAARMLRDLHYTVQRPGRHPSRPGDDKLGRI